MISARRPSRMAPGSAFLVVLLLLMLALSGVLAYQAQDAARSEIRSTRRALRGYAAFATWELLRGTEAALARDLGAAALRALPPPAAPPGDPAAELDGFAARVRAGMRWCGCPGAVRHVFRVDQRGASRTVALAGDAPELREWLAALALPAASGTGVPPVRVARTGTGELLAAYATVPGAGGARTYGFTVDAPGVAGAAFRETVRGTPLLPVALRGGASSGHALAIQIVADDGHTLYRSPADSAVRPPEDMWLVAKTGNFGTETASPAEVVDHPGGLLSGVTTRVSVRPEVAARLVADDDGARSRLPVLLTVFALTLTLVCVAIVQLRRQQELFRLREDFVSGVSHELRTPLAQIRLFSETLESGRLRTDDQRRRSVRIINEESQRLTYLVENILHFSRAQRGSGRVFPEPVEAGPLLREIVDSFAPLARTRGVEFATALEPGVVVRVDRDALRQVLLNLLDNAAKYGPRGQCVRVGMAIEGFAVRIQVDDQGPGVPPEERSRIWEPYRRLERDASSATGGSGIGLAVVRDLVELHGGRVVVEDAPGGGARFVVELPGAVHAGPPGEAARPSTSIAGVREG
ncbi:MAG: HAMP domain-containing histidine kinase [Gemmatimonadetes bacterium]|nr:HAMP domain-containing histidine kinase [Gemmatimonadota bacterium]